jgi:hypothetical protein
MRKEVLPGPEYVILEDFDFTWGRLYSRYKSTPARFVPGVFVNSLNCHILDDLSQVQVPPPSWQEFCDSRIFCCEDNILNKRCFINTCLVFFFKSIFRPVGLEVL